jgi:hypothetical protein
VADTGVFHFLPADTSEVAGNESCDYASAVQAIEQRAHSRAHLVPEVGAGTQINGLCVADNLGHGAANGSRLHSGGDHHSGENVGVEHSGDGHAVSRGLDSGGAANRINQGLAMVWTGAPNQRAVDIEEHQGW